MKTTSNKTLDSGRCSELPQGWMDFEARQGLLMLRAYPSPPGKGGALIGTPASDLRSAKPLSDGQTRKSVAGEPPQEMEVFVAFHQASYPFQQWLKFLAKKKQRHFLKTQ